MASRVRTCAPDLTAPSHTADVRSTFCELLTPLTAWWTASMAAQRRVALGDCGVRNHAYDWTHANAFSRHGRDEVRP